MSPDITRVFRKWGVVRPGFGLIAAMLLLLAAVPAALAQGGTEANPPGPLSMQVLPRGEGVNAGEGPGQDLDSAGSPDLALRWTTFLRGSGDEHGNAVVVGPGGDVYVAGATGPHQEWSRLWGCAEGDDAFVAHLDAGGNLNRFVVLGGDGNDCITGLSRDGDGNLFVVGNSSASWGDSPLRPFSGSSDVFVARLDGDGEVMWNTFLGASGIDEGRAIALDGDGNVYVAGESYVTWGDPVRAHAPQYEGKDYGDIVVAALTPDGNLVWNTFLGSIAPDWGYALTVAEDGTVTVGGESWLAWGDPVTEHLGPTDAFVARLANDGSLTWNTFLGREGADDVLGIFADDDGNVFATGGSAANGVDFDIFVAKLEADGDPVWFTPLGSGGSGGGASILVDGNGLVRVAGASRVAWGSPVHAYSDGYDIFVASLTGNGDLIEHTFFGGAGYDAGLSMSLAEDGNLFLAGDSASSWGRTVHEYSGGVDGFVARLGPGYFVSLPVLSAATTGPVLVVE